MISHKYRLFSGLSLMCGLLFTGCFPVERLYCNTAQWFVFDNQQKHYFGSQVSRYCHRYDNYDLDSCADLERKNRVRIKSPKQLDDYISSNQGRSSYEGGEFKGIYIGNLYNAIVNNYRNDYMVAKGLIALAEVQKESQPFYEYIVRLYLYDYFSGNKPAKTKYFDETCNLIAQAVDTLSGIYMAEKREREAIDLIKFTLNYKEKIDALRAKKLSERLAAMIRDETLPKKP